MGHDIYGINRDGEAIAYARFSMGNSNSVSLYSLLDAHDYFAGVSGTGEETTYTLQQIEKSWNSFKERNSNKNISFQSEEEFTDIDEKQIYIFIRNCLLTAQKEGEIKVYYG